jgi:hypothetical protein
VLGLVPGSGKKIQSSSTDPSGSRCSRTSGAFASTRRRFVAPARSASSIVREPRAEHLDGEEVALG